MPYRNRKPVASLTLAEARVLVTYNPDTGELRRVSTGQPAALERHRGYLRIKVAGAVVKAHRLAWLLHFGHWPSNYIDHINGVKTDNRLCNLRDVTPQQSVQNRGPCRPGKAVGISWHKRDRKWVATLMHDGVTRRLGRFDREQEAAAAYAEAALRIRGEFAWQGLHAQRMALTQGGAPLCKVGGTPVRGNAPDGGMAPGRGCA